MVRVMKWLTKGAHVFDRIVDFLAFVDCILIMCMMLFVTTDVVGRYYLKRPIMGTLEITEWLLLFIVFLGAPWLLREEGHVRIDLLVTRLPPRVKKVLHIITSCMGIMICLVLIWYGAVVTWDYFQKGVRSTTLLKIPLFPIVAIIPIGSFVLLIQFIEMLSGYRQSPRVSQDKENGTDAKN